MRPFTHLARCSRRPMAAAAVLPWRRAFSGVGAVPCSRPLFSAAVRRFTPTAHHPSLPIGAAGGFFAARRFQSGGTPDHYTVLGVSPTATQDEIKSAYKKLALEFHPDRNHTPGAEDKFKAISAAYSVVGNKDKRREYDMQRSMFGSSGGGRGGFQQQQQRPGGGGFAYPGSMHGGGYGQGEYQRMSKEEADRLFREIFGGMRVDQIFRDLEEEMRRGSMHQGVHSNTGPFFRQGAQSTNVFTDRFGNRMEETVFTDPSGRRFTVHRTTSTDPNASVNQTAEDYASRHTSRRDGRVHFGNSSHNYTKPNLDFTDHYFGFRSHGRSPLIAFLTLGAWFIILGTIFSSILYMFLYHPFFTLAVLFLVFVGRRGVL